MSGSTKRKHSFDGDDALRELMSSMLSGRYQEETYLGDVSSVCRSRPESVPRLLALIDRYKRLGRMPAAQHAKVRAKIDAVMAIVKPVTRGPVATPTSAADADLVGNIDHLVDEDDASDDDDLSEESSTREFVAPPETASPLKVAPGRAVGPGPRAAISASPLTCVLPAPKPSAREPSTPEPSPSSEPSSGEPEPAALPPPAVASSVAAAPAVTAPPVAAAAVPASSAPATANSAAATALPTPRAYSASAQTRVLPAEGQPLPPEQSRQVAANVAAREHSSAAASSATTSIGAGTILHDRYELQQLLGRGGIATVYKAVDRYRVNLGLEDCYVAVKVVQPHPSRPGSVAALGREFHNAQLLSHPNVINVFNIDHAGDASFYTMELLDGERLSQLVKRVGGLLPRRYALTILRDIGAAVAHAHSRGVVHADLKPHNVMITRTGQVRVLDFGSGLIRAREPWISELSPDETYRQATPAYASCEQLEGWSADPRDDIYALACLAYLLLTGRHPFDMQPSLEARAHHLQPRRPPRLSGEKWRALKRGLSWSREERTMAMEDWLQQLGVNTGAPSLPPLSLLHAAKPTNHWMHRTATAAIVVAALGLAAFTVQHQNDFDWPPTLTRAQDRLSGALRGLQSLADPAAESADSAASGSTPKVAHGSAAAPIAAAATAVRKDTAHTAPAVTSRSSRSASAAATASLTSSVTGAEHMAAAPTTALLASADGAEASSAPISDAQAGAAQTADPAANAPRLEFSAPSYVVPGTEPAARIVIRRNGSTDGDLSFVWWTEEGSAKADEDYASLGRRIERIPSGSDKITVYVPIISTPQRHEVTQFYVALGEPGSPHSSGHGTRSVVTIDHGS